MGKLKSGCMDPRSRESIDKGDALRLSRAGGFLGGNLKGELPNIIRRNSIDEVHIDTHDDCGAMGVIYMGINSPQSVHQKIHDAMVEPFLQFDTRGMSRERLENMAMLLNENLVLSIMNSREAGPLKSVTCKKLKTVGKVEGEKILLLIPFYEDNRKLSGVVDSLGFDNSTTYLITLVNGNPKRMTVDPQLALDHIHGITKVVLHAGKDDRYGVVNTIHNEINNGGLNLRGAALLRYE